MRTNKVELGLPAIAIHGDAGACPSGDSIEASWQVFVRGGSSLKAAVAAVITMENSGVFNAGRGAVPTTAGEVATDAGVMGLVVVDGTWRVIAGAALALTCSLPDLEPT